MILIEVEGGQERRFHLEFHPRLTVVSGLSVEQRQELLALITTAIHGGAVPAQFNVDVGGVPQLLTAELMASIGLVQEPVDNVLQAADLPGARLPVSGFRQRAVGQLGDSHALLAAAQDRLDELIRRRDSLRREVEELWRSSQALQTTNEHLASEQERLEAALRQAEAALDGVLRHETPDALEARLRRMHADLRSKLDALSAELTRPAVDVAPVQNALLALQQEHNEQRFRHIDMSDIAAELRRLEVAIAERSQLPTPPSWLVRQLRDELDEAAATLAGLEEEAQDSAVQAGVLVAARRRMEDAQAAWNEVMTLDGPDLATLRSRQEELFAAASVALQKPAHQVSIEDIEQYRSVNTSGVSAVQRVVDALTSVGVEVADHDQAVAVAERWLEQNSTRTAQREEQQEAIRRVVLDVEDVQRQLEGVPALRQAWEQESAAAERAVHQADEALQAFLAGVARQHSDVSSRRAAADAELRELDAEIASGAQDLQELQALFSPARVGNVSALAGDSLEDIAEPWWKSHEPIGGRTQPLRFEAVDVSSVSAQEVEYDLYERGVALRRGAFGESAPLLIDAAFDDLPIQDALRLLHLLPRITGVVQVIYLASNDVAETWALRQSEFDAAVVTLAQYSGS